MRKGNPWIVCFPAALYFFYVIVQMSILNTLNIYITHDFSLSTTKLGILSSSYFYMDAIFLFPIGILLDHFSNRKLLLVSMFICIISVTIFAYTHTFWILLIAHGYSGIANAFAFLGCMRLITLWFPINKHALVMGLMVTLGMLGGVIAQNPIVFLLEKLNWRSIMLINAGVGLIILTTMFLFIKDKFENKVIQHNKNLFQDVCTVLKNAQNWLAGIYAAFMNFPAMIFGILWGNLYLTQAHYLTNQKASFVTSMIFFGVIIGSPVIGRLSDWLQNRRKPMQIGACLAFLLILLIMHIGKCDWKLLAVLFFFMGFFSSAQIISFPSVAENNAENLSGTAISIVSIMLNFVTALIQPLFGWLMNITKAYHTNHTSAPTPIYSPESFKIALIIMPIAFLSSIMIATIMQETYKKQPTFYPKSERSDIL